MKNHKAILSALFVCLSVSTTSCIPQLTSKLLQNADFYTINDDTCEKSASFKKGKLLDKDGTEIATFSTLLNSGTVIEAQEVGFTDLRSGKSGNVKIIPAKLHEVAQALLREQHFVDAIQNSNIEALLLVESRAGADFAKPCSLFDFSAPVSINDNVLLLGQCPGALFFNGQEACEDALTLLKDTAAEEDGKQ